MYLPFWLVFFLLLRDERLLIQTESVSSLIVAKMTKIRYVISIRVSIICWMHLQMDRDGTSIPHRLGKKFHTVTFIWLGAIAVWVTACAYSSAFNRSLIGLLNGTARPTQPNQPRTALQGSSLPPGDRTGNNSPKLSHLVLHQNSIAILQ